MTNSRRAQVMKRRKKRRRKIFFFFTIPLLALVLGTTTYGALLMKKAASVVDQSYEQIDRDSNIKVNPKKDNIAILFLGVDDSDVRGFQDGSRTDAMMLATFNAKEKSVKMLSIPRDSYVFIPSKGVNSKINHAHAWGGVKSSIETVEQLLGIDIHYYVKMNFNAFIEVVDALNGIKVEVPYEVTEFNSKDEHDQIHLKPGLQHLNGEEALALARTRKLDNDIERGKRQQEIVKAIIKKSLSVSSITKYTDVMEAVGDNMALNISFNELTAFFNYATAGTNLEIDSLNIEGEDMYINGAYYYKLNKQSLEETKLILQNHLSNQNNSNTAE